jgi:nicotinamidase-related amidase
MGARRSAVSDVVPQHTATFALKPESTALLVIDMQYASASRGAGLGAWLELQGRAAEGDYRFTRIEQVLVPNIQRLLRFFRENELPRVFVRLGAQRSDYRDLMPQLRELESSFGNILGEREFEFLDELQPEDGEPVVTKLSASAFTSSGVDALLRNLAVTSVVFTGVSTSQCVDLTARDAADRGYSCLVVEDAVAEDTEEFHRWTLEQFERLFGRVASTDAVLAELGEHARARI